MRSARRSNNLDCTICTQAHAHACAHILRTQCPQVEELTLHQKQQREAFDDRLAHRDFLFALGEAFERRDMWLKAGLSYKEALELNPADADALARLTMIQQLLGEILEQEPE